LQKRITSFAAGGSPPTVSLCEWHIPSETFVSSLERSFAEKTECAYRAALPWVTLVLTRCYGANSDRKRLSIAVMAVSPEPAAEEPLSLLFGTTPFRVCAGS